MRYATQTNCGSNPEPATAILAFADNNTAISNDRWPCIDYSEEAIPERDPAYRLPAGTYCESQTIEFMPAAARRALARTLEEYGMNPARAAMVASL